MRPRAMGGTAGAPTANGAAPSQRFAEGDPYLRGVLRMCQLLLSGAYATLLGEEAHWYAARYLALLLARAYEEYGVGCIDDGGQLGRVLGEVGRRVLYAEYRAVGDEEVVDLVRAACRCLEAAPSASST